MRSHEERKLTGQEWPWSTTIRTTHSHQLPSRFAVRLSPRFLLIPDLQSSPFHDKSGQERPKKSWFFHGLCFMLHAVLVCAHVLILLVWITRIEHKVVFPIGKRSNMLSTALVQVSQIISTVGSSSYPGNRVRENSHHVLQVYIAGLILVSQQLATRRNIHARQTLTATHDNMSAWSGLGAALISVWHQTAIAASVTGSVLVAGYFICVTILHITAPAIFSIQPFNTTQYAVISTTMGPPNISINNQYVFRFECLRAASCFVH